MGWYDEENDAGLPAWAVSPMMWIGCFLAAVPPAAAVVAVCNLFLPAVPPAVTLGVYGLCLVGLVAAIRPWTAR